MLRAPADALRRIQNQHPQHLATLELVCRIYERAKGYQRALESPNLVEDARLALQYHLGAGLPAGGQRGDRPRTLSGGVQPEHRLSRRSRESTSASAETHISRPPRLDFAAGLRPVPPPHHETPPASPFDAVVLRARCAAGVHPLGLGLDKELLRPSLSLDGSGGEELFRAGRCIRHRAGRCVAGSL